jgi:hypothetical protein
MVTGSVHNTTKCLLASSPLMTIANKSTIKNKHVGKRIRMKKYRGEEVNSF